MTEYYYSAGCQGRLNRAKWIFNILLAAIAAAIVFFDPNALRRMKRGIRPEIYLRIFIGLTAFFYSCLPCKAGGADEALPPSAQIYQLAGYTRRYGRRYEMADLNPIQKAAWAAFIFQHPAAQFAGGNMLNIWHRWADFMVKKY